MQRSIFLKAATVFLFVGSLLFGGSYSLDPSHSSVGFKVKHMMISNVNGNFSEFDGSFELEKGKLKALEGVVQAASISTDNAKRDNHLRSADFFDVIKYPAIKFKMVRLDGDDIIGNLSIKGVTKEVKLAVDMGGETDDPWGNHRAGFSLEGKINRQDFGLSWNKLLETGGVVVGDEIKLMIEIEGIEKKD
jgi:polyisoprenoid-binding protein YceI